MSPVTRLEAGDGTRSAPADEGVAPVFLRIATYNVHRCKGLDGRTRPDRVAAVIASTEADTVALQEVLGAGPRHGSQAEYIAMALGMSLVTAPTRMHRGHPLGNAVLSRHPIVFHEWTDLTYRWYSRRNCLRAEILVGHRSVHVFNVHLGTGYLERRLQSQGLEAFINHDVTRSPRIVLGDFNEWPRGEVTRMLLRSLKAIDLTPFLPRRRTYPGVLPLVHLDHIFYEGDVELMGVHVPRSRRALVASDHLPLVASLRLLAPVEGTLVGPPAPAEMMGEIAEASGSAAPASS